MPFTDRAPSKNLLIQQCRGSAIAAVLLMHFSLFTQFLALLPVNVTNTGYLGVDLFFVISGFVVTRSLRNGGWSPLRFAIRRAFRLYPAMLLFLGLCALVWISTIVYPAGALPRQLFGASHVTFLTQGLAVLTGTLTLIGGDPIYVNGAMWSLTIEFQFYMAIALLMFVSRTCGGGGRACENALLWLMIGVAGYYASVRLALVAGMHPPWPAGLLWKRFDFLAAGTLLALAPEKWLLRITFGHPTRVFACAVCIPFLSLMAFRHPYPPVQPHSRDWLEIIGYPICLLGFTWAIAAAATIEDSRIGSSWAGRAMLWLGDRSYSLYLVHFPIFALLWMCFYEIDLSLVSNPWIYSPMQFAVGLALTLWVADFCFRWIEKPGIRLGARLFGAPGSLPPSPATTGDSVTAWRERS